MMSSVPGADVVALVPPAEGVPDPAAAARYNDVLARLATTYSVSSPGQVTATARAVTTLTPAGGLVSTVRDFAQFDLALRKGILLRPETLELAWTPATGRRRTAAAARARLVRAAVQRRARRLAIRRRRTKHRRQSS